MCVICEVIIFQILVLGNVPYAELFVLLCCVMITISLLRLYTVALRLIEGGKNSSNAVKHTQTHGYTPLAYQCTHNELCVANSLQHSDISQGNKQIICGSLRAITSCFQASLRKKVSLLLSVPFPTFVYKCTMQIFSVSSYEWFCVDVLDYACIVNELQQTIKTFNI